MNVNIPYNDMTLPVQGPENPFSDRNRFENQNALAGHVEEQAMTEHAFRQQHLTYSILGYSANPSVDPNAPSFLGNVEKAQANGFATLNSVRTSRSEKKELKRKRKAKGDLDVVDGEGAYVGPWASWENNDKKSDIPEPVVEVGDEEESESEEEQPVARRDKKSKAKRVGAGQETSTFHGKSLTDYQDGLTCIHRSPKRHILHRSQGLRSASFRKFVYTHTLDIHKECQSSELFQRPPISSSVDQWIPKSR